MSKLILDISVSLDGYVAGPEPTLDRPLGVGGDRLHAWMTELEAFRKSHGMPGGEVNEDSGIVEEATRNLGATVMGRRMFSGGEGAWKTIRTPTPGSATTRRSGTRCSSSPTTRGTTGTSANHPPAWSGPGWRRPPPGWSICGTGPKWSSWRALPVRWRQSKWWPCR